MKQLLLICAVVALVGCGGGTPDLTAHPEIEKAIRAHLAETRGVMPTGELTKEDFDKVKELKLIDGGIGDAGLKEVVKLTKLEELSLGYNKLTSVKGLENLTQLKQLFLDNNKLTDVKGLEKLNQLTWLDLRGNPDLTKAQIIELQKALPNCIIYSNPKK